MIYVNCLDISQISDELYQTFYAAASKERQEKADRCRFLEDKKRCIMSDILLKYGLCAYRELQISDVQLKEEMRIAIGENGKPYIKNMDGFFYNLSHSGKWVVLAYGNHEVGVDVEKFRENANLERITRRFFTEEERAYIFAEAEKWEKIRRFTKIWTYKESYVKYLGTGLAKGLRSFSINGDTDILTDASGNLQEDILLKSWLLDGEYYLSVCSSRDEVVRKSVNIEELREKV